MNNTLSISTCTADESLDPNYGDIAHENWQCASSPRRSLARRLLHVRELTSSLLPPWSTAVYAPPIIARLEAALPGISLTAQDVN